MALPCRPWQVKPEWRHLLAPPPHATDGASAIPALGHAGIGVIGGGGGGGTKRKADDGSDDAGAAGAGGAAASDTIAPPPAKAAKVEDGGEGTEGGAAVPSPMEVS